MGVLEGVLCQVQESRSAVHLPRFIALCTLTSCGRGPCVPSNCRRFRRIISVSVFFFFFCSFCIMVFNPVPNESEGLSPFKLSRLQPKSKQDFSHGSKRRRSSSHNTFVAENTSGASVPDLSRQPVTSWSIFQKIDELCRQFIDALDRSRVLQRCSSICTCFPRYSAVLNSERVNLASL